MWFPKWLWPTGKHDAVLPEDGFGQSLADDARFIWRFRACWRRSVAWRPPDDAERQRYDTHPLYGRFGDSTIAIAQVDGRLWIVRERDWHGWPDPPRFVFFAVEPDGTVWSARDFSHWPQVWKRPSAER